MSENNTIMSPMTKNENNTATLVRVIQYDDFDGPFDYEYLQRFSGEKEVESNLLHAEVKSEIEFAAAMEAKEEHQSCFFDRAAKEDQKDIELVRGVIYLDKNNDLADDTKPVDNGLGYVNNPPMTNQVNIADAFNWIKQLGEAKVFEYQKPDLSDLEVKKGPKPANIVEDLLDTYIVRSLDTDLYVWRTRPTCYYLMAGMEAQRFIDSFCKNQYPGNFVEAKTIDEVKKTLLYDCRIASLQKDVLPVYLWPFKDGLVNIEKRCHEDEPFKWFYTETLSACFEPDAECPVFDKFLASAMCNDPRLVEQVWRIIGYILSPDFRAKKFFVFIGPKDSGKSLMAKVIQGLLDDKSCAAMGISEFGVKFTSSELVGKKLAVCMDLSNETLSTNCVGAIKAITGGDVIRAEAKYKPAVTVPITAKLLFGSNHALMLKEVDTAFADRQIAVPFLNPIPEDRQDRFLYEKIMSEVAGIAAKAADAYLRLLHSGYDFLEEDKKTLLPVELDHDKVVKKFIDSCCDFTDASAKVLTRTLYGAYTEFAIGLGLPTLEIKPFSERFNKLKPSGKKNRMVIDGENGNGYEGVALKS